MSREPNHRLPGSPPAVGIRPTIDGRWGGVRESLEQQTMGMAQAAAKLIRSRMRHAGGQIPEVVVSPVTIGGAAEAARCAEHFRQAGVGLTLTVTPCWCYGAETMDMDPLLPKAVWGFNGTERPGAVYLAAVLAGHSQKGLPAFGIYGHEVQDAGDSEIPADVSELILRFVRAGLAVAAMRGTSYLAMGGVSMGIAGSVVDPRFFQQYLGMRSETVDMVEFVRRMERGIYDPEEYARALEWTRSECLEGRDFNTPEKRRSREQLDQDWEKSVQMALIARDLMAGNPRLAELGFAEEALGHHASAGGFQGQRQWTDHLPNGDFLEAILSTSWDWNGIRQPYIVATENDSLNGAGMLFGHLLTGAAQLFADVRTYWSPTSVERVTGHRLEGGAAGGLLHLINSGPAALDWTGKQRREGRPAVKPWWEIEPEEAAACRQATRWCPSMVEYFPGGGWSTDFLTEGGIDCTMFRLNLVEGLGPVLQIAEGATVDLPEEVHEALDLRTNPTWPTTWFAPRLSGQHPYDSVYSVMNAWGANHCVVAPGHIGSDLISLAACLRIPVDMHNLPADRLFRPSAWTRFGALDPQGADYRACAAYGPLYR